MADHIDRAKPRLTMCAQQQQQRALNASNPMSYLGFQILSHTKCRSYLCCQMSVAQCADVEIKDSLGYV